MTTTQAATATTSGADWRDSSACNPRNRHLFQAQPGEDPGAQAERETRAVQICSSCWVVTECLSDVLDQETTLPEVRNVVRGGMRPADRAAILSIAERRRGSVWTAA